MNSDHPWIAQLPEYLDLAEKMYEDPRGRRFWDHLELDMYERIGSPGDWSIRPVLMIYLLLEATGKNPWALTRGEFKPDAEALEFVKFLLTVFAMEE